MSEMFQCDDKARLLRAAWREVRISRGELATDDDETEVEGGWTP